MRTLALMILGLMVVGCMSPPDRALRDNVIGAYEYEFFGKGKFVIDGMSVLYVAGTEINYVREVFGSHFEIKNPTAKSSCGCGESFAV